MKNIKLSSAIAFALSLSASPSILADDHGDKNKHSEVNHSVVKHSTTNAEKNNKYTSDEKEYKSADLSSYDNGDAIIMSGKIIKVDDDELTLAYGDRKVEVEFDNWPWEDVDLTTMFNKGERITVSGVVDKDLFSSNEIEANNVYLDDQYVYYYFVDATPAYYIETAKVDSQKRAKNNSSKTVNKKMNDRNFTDLNDGAFFSASGEIVKIDGREFTLKTKNQMINVDTQSLTNNPLDNNGLQQLALGDRVYVYGEIDDKFYDEKELSADSIITLKDARTMKRNDEMATN